MIRTKTDYRLLPEGIYHLTVSRKPKLENKSGYDYYVFDFEAVDKNGYKQDYREFFFPNEERLKKVLLEFGGTEDREGEVQVDEDDVVGEFLTAEIKHVVIKGRTRAKIERVVKEKKADEDEEEPPF